MPDRLLETFLDLVRIDSPSGEEAACGRYCARELAAAGMAVHFDDTAEQTGSDIGNLIATLPAAAPGEHVVLSAHLDTVEPGRGVEPVVEHGVVRPAGQTVLGGDDKAGIAAIVEAVRRLGDGRPHAGVTVVLTVQEERGLKGAKALAPGSVDGDLCVVLDADGVPGGIVVGAPTHYTFVADFFGRAAHAGVEPEQGRSALKMAADAMCAMRLGRLDETTTANIGSIHGGNATNVVAPTATMTGECRSLDRERVEGVCHEMDNAMRRAAAGLDGSVEVSWTKEYDGFLFSQDDPVVTLVAEACRDSGVEPRLFSTGGGSDGNVFTAKGLPTLVLSCGLSKVHSLEETLRVRDLAKTADILEALLRRAVE